MEVIKRKATNNHQDNLLIDTHAHINFNAFRNDGDEVIKRTLENNIWLINVGSQYSTSQRAVSYALKYKKGVFAAVGLHPIHLKKGKIKEEIDPLETIEFETREEKFDYQKYKEIANQPKVIAIGETGLDYYHITYKHNSGIKNLQKEVFLEHLKLAKKLDKPVIIHCRQAHQDVLEILKSQVLSYKLKGVVHSFSGNWQQAQEYFSLGFLISFNGLITYCRDYDKVIKNMPLEKLILETDCPYLTPIPFRGKRNEPIYLKYVAEKIAEIKGVSFEEVAKITSQNAKNLFNF